MEDTTTPVEENKTHRFTKKLAAKIAAGSLAFVGVCALGYKIVKSDSPTTTD
jgi:hypothetical protein